MPQGLQYEGASFIENADTGSLSSDTETKNQERGVFTKEIHESKNEHGALGANLQPISKYQPSVEHVMLR